MSTTYFEFLNKVIDTGIEGAKADYHSREDFAKLTGSVEGFEACRGKVPAELGKLLAQASTDCAKSMNEEDPHYWKLRAKLAEIEFTCNVVSAMLLNERQQPIITPTVKGTIRCAILLQPQSC